MMEECQICFEALKTTDTVECVFCMTKFCKKCSSIYLLNSVVDPSCPSCRKLWSYEFLVVNLGNKFVTKPFKEKRKQDLKTVEMALMPQTLAAMRRDNNTIDNKVVTTHNKDLKPTAANDMNHPQTRVVAAAATMNNDDKLIMSQDSYIKCADSNCRGYVNVNSENYRCQLCSIKMCKRCRLQIIVDDDNNHHHVCDEDIVKTVELIKTKTKPCPACLTPIQRSVGCNTMFCTACNTGFNWKTLKVIHGTIYNPHYFTYKTTKGDQKQQHVYIEPRIPLQTPVPRHCGSGEILIGIFTSTVLPKSLYSFQACVRKYVQKLQKIRDSVILNNEDLRIKYLNNKYTENQFLAQVYRRKRKNDYLTSVANVYETFVFVGREMLENCVKVVMTRDNRIIQDKMEITGMKISHFKSFVDEIDSDLQTLTSIYKLKAMPKLADEITLD